jgi:putative tricarboxylic transport membrane protein
LALAIAWIAVVLGTFPEGYGGPTSSRTFPLISAAALAVLSVILIAGTFKRQEEGKGQVRRLADALEWRGIAATFGFLAAYIALLHFTGFVLATIVVLAAFLYFVLGKRSPWLLLGYSLGFAFGVWFILGQLMAVYLPRGSLINLF